MSLLEKIEVCFLDDRDPVRNGEDRWKVRPIRKVGRTYEIQINGIWCDAFPRDLATSKKWESKGCATSQYGTIHKDWRQTASDQYGYARHNATAADTPLTIKACAVMGVHWPVDAAQVKRVYRQLVKSAHPDTGGDVERFRQIQEAYEVLKSVVEVAA